MANFNLFGQKLSPTLDSILVSTENDSTKKKLYNELFNNYIDEGNNTQLGSDAHELAKWYYRQGKKQEPITYTQLAIEARKKAIPFNSSDLKISYYNLGFFYKKNKEYSKSISALKKMLSIKEPSLFNARSYTSIADSYDILGDPFLAVENHLNAFLFFDPVKDSLRIINNHINIAYAYKAIRKPSSGKKAIKHLIIADSLTNSLKTPIPDLLQSVYKNIGAEYYEGYFDQDIDKAIFYFKKALKIAKQMSRNDYIGRLYYNLGIAYIEKDVSMAKAYFSKSLKYPENNDYLKPSIYLGFGLAAYKNREYTKAQEYYSQSLSHFFTKEKIKNDWLPNKNQLKSIINKDLLLELFKRKLLTAIDQGMVKNDNSFYDYAVEVSKASDLLIDIMLAEDISHKSKLFWRDLASEIYVLALEACYQTQELEDAFYFMEKNKALLLMQDVSRNKIKLPENILEKELELKNNIITLQTELVETSEKVKDSVSLLLVNTKEQLYQFKDSLSTLFPEYFSKTTIPRILPFSEIVLNDNELVLQYTMAEKIAGAVCIWYDYK
ncbi:tetratricopeptide repeat protein [Aquimarina sp. M1]